MEDLKGKFIDICKNHIGRDGADKLLEWLEKSDFFTAPASTKYHLAKQGGLLQHSLNVRDRLEYLCHEETKFNKEFTMPSFESIAICGLLHDLCKVNLYKTEMRNRKNEQGRWEQYPCYIHDDKLPYGHGEKSVYIASGFMKLTREEAMAIRWHMGPWQDGEKQEAGRAFEMYPLALLTHVADMQATFIDEKTEKE